MKKIKFLSLMLVALMLLLVVGCGNKTPEGLVKAKDYVNNLYINDSIITPDDY